HEYKPEVVPEAPGVEEAESLAELYEAKGGEMSLEEKTLLQQINNYEGKTELQGVYAEDAKNKAAEFLAEQAKVHPEYLDKYPDFKNTVQYIYSSQLNSELHEGFLGFGGPDSKDLMENVSDLAKTYGLSTRGEDKFFAQWMAGNDGVLKKSDFSDIMTDKQFDLPKFEQKIDEFKDLAHSPSHPGTEWEPREVYDPAYEKPYIVNMREVEGGYQIDMNADGNPESKVFSEGDISSLMKPAEAEVPPPVEVETELFSFDQTQMGEQVSGDVVLGKFESADKFLEQLEDVEEGFKGMPEETKSGIARAVEDIAKSHPNAQYILRETGGHTAAIDVFSEEGDRLPTTYPMMEGDAEPYVRSPEELRKDIPPEELEKIIAGEEEPVPEAETVSAEESTLKESQEAEPAAKEKAIEVEPEAAAAVADFQFNLKEQPGFKATYEVDIDKLDTVNDAQAQSLAEKTARYLIMEEMKNKELPEELIRSISAEKPEIEIVGDKVRVTYDVDWKVTAPEAPLEAAVEPTAEGEPGEAVEDTGEPI
ncbi:hypothetical protein MYX07_01345, partial [Patescibacteria group bacterium AH-259-L07]|nr:hypothetical protein [Patescibacteria group bacterium AH-259-L07]